MDDDDGNFDEQFSITRGREGTIYLIDADEAITGDSERFRLCLECIEADLLKTMLTNSRDMVSVVFYNTEKSPSPDAVFKDSDELMPTIIPSNCAVLIPLKPLSKDIIQYFKGFCQSDDFFDFKNKYGSSNKSCFSEALWLCSRLIIRCTYKLNNSKIVLFTNNDQPHMPGTNELQQTFIRATDLKMNNIIVNLVPMVKEDNEFDMNPFYKEFLCAIWDIEPDELRWNEPSTQRYILLNRLYCSDFRKNCLRHMKLELSDGLAISCDIHSFTRIARKPTAIKIVRETNDVANPKRSNYVSNPNPDDGGSVNEVEVTSPKRGHCVSNSTQNPNDKESVNEVEVFASDLMKVQSICCKDILFTSEEVTQLKSLIAPGIRLIGFKPLSELKSRWFVKNCSFLYPSEKKIKGSTKLFRALWEKCLEKKKYALCTLTYRIKASPK